MKKLLIAIAAVMVAAATYGQGQVNFSNRVGAEGLDAPVLVLGTQNGPGAGYSAQLFLADASGTTFTALDPASTFFAPTATAPTRDRYWQGTTVTVPGVTSGNATFRVRAWETAAGSFDAASKSTTFGFGESANFQAEVTTAPNPPKALVNLQGFTVTVVPEPSVIALGVLGASALLLRRRKQ
jgi:hypothetical protein